MRMKLGTLKRIIREAVGEALSEGRPPPYDVDKNLQAAIAMNKFVADLPSTKAVAADRERRAAGDAAYRERMKAEQEAQQAAVMRNREKNAKYMADMRAVAAAAGVEKKVIDNLLVNAYVDYQKYPRPDGSFFTDQEIVDMAEGDMAALSSGAKTPLDISKAARAHTAAALSAFSNKPPHRSM